MHESLCSPSSPWYLTNGPPNFSQYAKVGKATIERLNNLRKVSPSKTLAASPDGKSRPLSSRKRAEEEQRETGLKGEHAEDAGGSARKVQRTAVSTLGKMGLEKEESVIVTELTVHSVLEEVKKEKDLTRDLAKLIASSVTKKGAGTESKKGDRQQKEG
jgi:hypothetical protein